LQHPAHASPTIPELEPPELDPLELAVPELEPPELLAVPELPPCPPELPPGPASPLDDVVDPAHAPATTPASIVATTPENHRVPWTNVVRMMRGSLGASLRAAMTPSSIVRPFARQANSPRGPSYTPRR
jgi:hypothetical protein